MKTTFPTISLLAMMLLNAHAEKPNVLFIFADDMAYDTIAAHGNPEIKTPNIDRLVKRGMTFTHAYNMGGYHGAVCVASRTMLNTGVFLWHAQKIEKELKQWQDDGKMWSQLMGKAGYDTYFTGKWHVKADTQRIFTRAEHTRGGMPKQTKEGYNRPIDGQPDPWDPSDPKFGGFWEGGKHWSEVVGDDALSFIDQAKGAENPFFMYIAFNAPHDPRQAPKEYVDMYPVENITLPVPFLAEYPYKDSIGCGRSLRDEKLAPFPRTENAVKVNRREYYAIITHMDAQIGRILDGLEKSGKANNTYIVFSADHGLGCGHHGLLGKQNMYDHSIRVPWIIAGPGVPAAKSIDGAIYLQDAMPTILEIAGAPVPDYVQFHSVLPMIKGTKTRNYDSIYGAYTMLQRQITIDGWKLIYYPKISRHRLYNLGKDPQETKDLSGSPEHARRISRMMKVMKDWQPVTGDPLDLDKPVPAKPRKKKAA